MKVVGNDAKTFLKKVLHPKATETQRLGMEMAFYAGSKSMLMMMRTISEDNVEEEVGLAILNKASDEIDDYFKGLPDVMKKMSKRGPNAGM